MDVDITVSMPDSVRLATSLIMAEVARVAVVKEAQQHVVGARMARTPLLPVPPPERPLRALPHQARGGHRAHPFDSATGNYGPAALSDSSLGQRASAQYGIQRLANPLWAPDSDHDASDCNWPDAGVESDNLAARWFASLHLLPA